jgi:hypothetical protein
MNAGKEQNRVRLNISIVLIMFTINRTKDNGIILLLLPQQKEREGQS